MRIRGIRNTLSILASLLGVVGVVILLQILSQAFFGQAHPVANWAVGWLDKLMTPVGRWFKRAPDWAWTSVVMIVNIPAAILLTWALDVAVNGMKRKTWFGWIVAFWVIATVVACVGIRWARQGGGFM
ncbi:MAG: hypothetical protein N2689_11585 [Verrucomicrobiae bacterium]|nr:hypothetical protein [Verrucomicrobiae bacterium]